MTHGPDWAPGLTGWNLSFLNVLLADIDFLLQDSTAATGSAEWIEQKGNDMRDNTVYNTALERLEARFPHGNLIPVKDAADYLGVDQRTLTARKDFPIRLGTKGVVAKERLAFWQAHTEG